MNDTSDNPPDTGPEPGPAGYYHSQRNRKFVRSVEGEYNLTHEPERLRAVPHGWPVTGGT